MSEDENVQGAFLNTTKLHWEVEGPKTFVDLFKSLQGWVEKGDVLYFEGGTPDTIISNFMEKYSIPAKLNVGLGTIFPKPKIYHVPAKPDFIKILIDMMENHAEPELAVHFHIYRDDKIILEWHDAFSQPMLLGNILESQVKNLCLRFKKTYNEVLPS